MSWVISRQVRTKWHLLLAIIIPNVILLLWHLPNPCISAADPNVFWLFLLTDIGTRYRRLQIYIINYMLSATLLHVSILQQIQRLIQIQIQTKLSVIDDMSPCVNTAAHTNTNYVLLATCLRVSIMQRSLMGSDLFLFTSIGTRWSRLQI